MKLNAVLIVGATSSMARAIAHRLAKRGTALHLAARDAIEVERTAQDLNIRYRVPVSWSVFEASDIDHHAAVFQKAIAQLGELDGVFVSLGELGDQSKAQSSVEHARQIIDSNYTGVVSILTHSANYLEKRGSGVIVGISSVAGDRGRQSNYVYGSAKAALSTFLQGLRNRLSQSGVQVLTVKPGFVDTKMTFGKPGMFLVASPDQVAIAILKALDAGRAIVYVPWFWFWIMLMIRTIPEAVFKRLNL